MNLKDGKIWNFWVQNAGSRECGEVLVVKGSFKWQDIQQGQNIPEKAIYSGWDGNGDKVWVGKNRAGEPGKINVADNNAAQPKMHKLWCSSAGSSTEAHILVLQ